MSAKIKSKKKGIFFEKWKTPVTSVQSLWVQGILHTAGATHFCLTVDKKKDVHLFSIAKREPYRVYDEDHNCFIWKYLEPNRSLKKKRTVPQIWRTWKIWNTPFIKEMDKGYYLSNYAKKRDPEIFQYLIVTQDEYIEFISDFPPRYEVFKKSNLVDILKHVLKHESDATWWEKSLQ